MADMFKKQISKECKRMKCVGRLCVHEHMGGGGRRKSKNVPGHKGCAVMYLARYFGFILNTMEPLGNFEWNRVVI